MIAGSLAEAAGSTMFAVQHWAQNPAINIHDNLANWESTFLQFDEESVDQRTVRNWKVPTAQVLASISNVAEEQTRFASDIAVVVYAAVCAAFFADADGRITPAQAAQVLADWNTYWGW